MNIAIIGAGNVGKALAASALRAGHTVSVSSASGDSAAPQPRRQAPGRRSPTGRPSRERTSWCWPFRTRQWTRCSEHRRCRRRQGPDRRHQPAQDRLLGARHQRRLGRRGDPGQGAGGTRGEGVQHAFAARQADPTVAGGLRVDGYVAGDDEDAKATVLGLAEDIASTRGRGRPGDGPLPGGHGLAQHQPADEQRLELAGRLEARRAGRRCGLRRSGAGAGTRTGRAAIGRPPVRRPFRESPRSWRRRSRTCRARRRTTAPGRAAPSAAGSAPASRSSQRRPRSRSRRRSRRS